LRQSKLNELINAVKFEKKGLWSIKPFKNENDYFVNYYGYGLEKMSLYNITNDLKMVTRIERITFYNHKINIEGHAYVSRIDSNNKEDIYISAFLINEGGEVLLPINVDLKDRKDITHNYGVQKKTGSILYDYKWSGFEMDLSFSYLLNDKMSSGKFYIVLHFQNGILYRESMVGLPISNKIYLKKTVKLKDSMVTVSFDELGNLVLIINQEL
ncbi:hypothetical protein DFO70_108339, partial [Cytobacillus firmus]